MSYIYVIIAVLLLAFEFALSKKYQSLEGVQMAAAFRFNALSGLLSAVVMAAVLGFRLEWSAFSALMATGMTVCCMSYSVLSFQVLKMGSMALYSTFLMSGGMLLPYFYGVLFLSEELTLSRIIGVLFVLSAVILSNLSKQKVNRKLLILCCAVFFLNGAVSIISKCHQVSTAYKAVSSSEFVVYSGIAKLLLSTAALLFCKKEEKTMSCRLSYGVVAGAAIIGSASYLLQLIGAKTLPATVLYPMVTGGSIIFSALAGSVFFKEQITRRQTVSIVLCFIGTLLFL